MAFACQADEPLTDGCESGTDRSLWRVDFSSYWLGRSGGFHVASWKHNSGGAKGLCLSERAVPG